MNAFRANVVPAVSAWLLSLAIACTAATATASSESPEKAAQQALADAEQLYRREGPESALPVFQELVQVFQSSGDQPSEAIAIGYVGEIYWRLGDYQQAGEFLQRALTMKQAAGDRLQEGKTLNILGLLHWDLGEFEQAQAYLRKGSAIAAELGDKALQGAILNNLSLVHDELGDYYVSLDQYQQVLGLYREADFPRGEGDTLGNIGGVYLLLGRYREALDYYQRALAISEQLDSTIALSQDHGNIAHCYLGLGQVDVALEHLGQAIDLATGAGMKQDQAYWLRTRGSAQMLKGRYDLALADHREALALYERIGSKTEAVEAQHDMGRMYLLLGDSVSAESYFRRSIQLAREIGLSRAITTNLLALGDLQQRQGQLDAATALYAEGTELAQQAGEQASWTEGLLRLSALHRDQMRLDDATEEAAQALQIANEMGAYGLIGQAVYAQAELNRLQSEPATALKGFDQALAILGLAPDSELEWQVQYGKGLALDALGDKEAAIEALESAVTLIERVRDQLREDRFRAGYVQDKYQVYIDLVRLQLEAGREQKAFSTAERLRSRSYLELIEQGLPPDVGATQSLREYAMRQRILALRKALAEENNRGLPEQRQLAVNVYSQELLAAERDYQAFLDDQHLSDPGGPRSAVPTYSQVRAELALDEALLEYVVGSDHLMLFLLTQRALKTYTITVRREDLDNKVELLRDLIRRQDSDHWQKPAGSLAAYLLAPVMANGQLDGIHHLYLVPHGNLNYLPFALLPSPGVGDSRRLVEDFTLAYLPTAAALHREHHDSRRTASMLVLAPEASHLQFAFAEARAISALYQPNSQLLLGKGATESSFRQMAPDYRLLHLATHGFFNKLNPMLSGLQLEADAANDGRLELHEILGMQLDADLVTLSACQTGLGSGYFAEVPAGDDYVALTRAFLYAGSTSVLATLWEVDDASTLALMKQFYGDLRPYVDRDDKATALALAQRALLYSGEYKHPYFWAPFVLMGEMGHDRRKQI